MKSNPPSRPLVWIAMFLLFGAAGMLVAGCGRSAQLSPLSDQEQAELDAYEKIRLALANDDFVAARKSAAILASLVKPSDMQANARTIADAMALDRQRQAFRSLSAELAPLVKGRPGYYLFSAPLEPQAVWIQRIDSADNPYMGKVMHDSGAPTS